MRKKGSSNHFHVSRNLARVCQESWSLSIPPVSYNKAVEMFRFCSLQKAKIWEGVFVIWDGVFVIWGAVFGIWEEI